MLRRLLVAVALLFVTAAPAAHADPGVLLEAQPTTVFVGPFPAPVKAWHLLYRSTSATGAPDAVSGTLLVPPAPWLRGGPRPLITYAVGTHGLGDQCAPSNLLAHGIENESALLAQALSQGWAVVVTDYEGLGTPGTHTYAVGQSEGRAVLDAARAASRVTGAGLSPSGPIGVFGYSQGGQAAAWAAELQGTYAPELNVVGVAAGGVPADLNAVFAGSRSWGGLVPTASSLERLNHLLVQARGEMSHYAPPVPGRCHPACQDGAACVPETIPLTHSADLSVSRQPVP